MIMTTIPVIRTIMAMIMTTTLAILMATTTTKI